MLKTLGKVAFEGSKILVSFMVAHYACKGMDKAKEKLVKARK
jgi:hypothetical protein